MWTRDLTVLVAAILNFKMAATKTQIGYNAILRRNIYTISVAKSALMKSHILNQSSKILYNC